MTLILTHAPTEETSEVAKEEFYSSLEKVCDAFPNSDVTRVLRDFNAEVGKVSYLYPACGGHSLHNETNDNGKWMINFALERDLAVTGTLYHHKDIHEVTWKSPENKICNQIDHTLVNRSPCTNVCDLRSKWGAGIQSDHFIVRAKIRLEVKRSEKTKESEINVWDIGKLKTKQ